MLLTLKRSIKGCFNIINSKPRYYFGEIQEFTSEELKNAEKYVEETLRSRTWITYMLASYIPQKIKPSFYALHLLDI